MNKLSKSEKFIIVYNNPYTDTLSQSGDLRAGLFAIAIEYLLNNIDEDCYSDITEDNIYDYVESNIYNIFKKYGTKEELSLIKKNFKKPNR